MQFIDLITFIYLILFSIYHLIQGILSVFFSDFAIKFNQAIYGFKPKETKQLKMTFKPWGSFAFSIGLIGFMIIINIEKYYIFLLPFIILLSFRVGYRTIYYKDLKEYWKVSIMQNIRMIIIQLIGILLFSYFIFNRII